MTFKPTLKRLSLLTLVGLFLVINNPLLLGQNSTDLEQWTRDYASDLSQPDWKESMAKYGWDGDYKIHQEFRNAFADFKTEVHQVVTDGTNVMAIMYESADWVGSYEYNVLKDGKPTGNKVEWVTVWSFNVIDGKLGGKWESVTAGQVLMRSAGVNCLPKE
jgi:predicted ester cyclase